MNKSNKVIVILGPTSSGKTKFGVDLAVQLNGEIISADSRQVYRGMDVGTGKDLGSYQLKIKNSELKIAIPYHLIDVVDPKNKFDVAKYQKLALKAIADILQRGKVPIIVGGSGLYLQAVVDNYDLKKTKTDQKLRQELENKTVPELYQILLKIDAESAQELNESDRQNPRRLMRKIELAQNGGEVGGKQASPYDFLVLGIDCPKEILDQRIYQRILKRLEQEDMLGEVLRLHQSGLSWERLMEFGLEYKYLALYLQQKIDYTTMVQDLFVASRQFAKRQMTWFRRWEKQGGEIKWVKREKDASKLVESFLANIK